MPLDEITSFRHSCNQQYIDMDLDEIFPLIGELGLYQVLLVLSVSLSHVSDACYQMGQVFLTAPMEFSCKIPRAPGLLNLTLEALRNASIPWEKGADGDWGFNHCTMYVRNYSSLTMDDLLVGTGNLTVTECQAWEYDTSDRLSSIVSKVSKSK